MHVDLSVCEISLGRIKQVYILHVFLGNHRHVSKHTCPVGTWAFSTSLHTHTHTQANGVSWLGRCEQPAAACLFVWTHKVVGRTHTMLSPIWKSWCRMRPIVFRMLADSNEDCDYWEIFYWKTAFIIIIIPHSFHKSAMLFFKVNCWWGPEIIGVTYFRFLTYFCSILVLQWLDTVSTLWPAIKTQGFWLTFPSGFVKNIKKFIQWNLELGHIYKWAIARQKKVDGQQFNSGW